MLDERIFLTQSGTTELHIIEGDLLSTKTVPNGDGVTVSNGRVYHWSANGFYVLEPDDTSTRLIPFNSFFGTRMGSTTNVQNGMLFNINRTLDRYEIWATNGTPEGTTLVENVTDTSDEGLLGFQQIGDSIYFAATNEGFRQSLWKVAAPTIEAVEAPNPPAFAGDVTGDQRVTVDDIDAVFAAAAAGTGGSDFDINQDNQVTTEDGRHIVETILETRLGDLDLNGKVEFADFLILSANFGSPATSYAAGDTDGDGMVAFSDFLLLSNNFGFRRQLT